MTALAWFNIFTASVILIRALHPVPGKHADWTVAVVILMFTAYLAQSILVLTN